MLFDTKTIQLKNGRQAIFRSPLAEDAIAMIEYLKCCSSETNFILRYPEECVETADQEAAYLMSLNESPSGMMIVCVVDGEIAGNCQIAFNKRLKIKHRASIAIAIIKKYWNLGIGTAMLHELIQIAEQHQIFQLELDFIEGNERGKHLYEKMGFKITAEKPNAICLKDGTMLKEYSMVKQIG